MMPPKTKIIDKVPHAVGYDHGRDLDSHSISLQTFVPLVSERSQGSVCAKMEHLNQQNRFRLSIEDHVNLADTQLIGEPLTIEAKSNPLTSAFSMPGQSPMFLTTGSSTKNTPLFQAANQGLAQLTYASVNSLLQQHQQQQLPETSPGQATVFVLTRLSQIESNLKHVEGTVKLQSELYRLKREE